ncbi:MAG TPA: signal peptidase I [Thermoanaerobaculia bacterium]|nr:signal peptidase I [Thermoanaerobaculia bacterium]
MPRQKSLFRTIAEPIAISIALAALVRAAVHIYSIPSASMAPALEVGDQILVTRYFTPPERGHVVVFQSPMQPDELMVKRVVGVPGDRIDSRFGRVRIDGHTLPEPYVLRAAATGAIETQFVPRDCYYVLGDNRDESLDSRNWGVVPREHIVGRARLVLWSAPLREDVEEASASTRSRTPAPRVRPLSRVFKWID